MHMHMHMCTCTCIRMHVRPARLQHTEDFSYLLVRRAPALAPGETDSGAAQGGWGRLVRPPRKRKGHVLLDLCMPSGDVVSEAVSSAMVSPLAYRRARKAKQGRIWPLELMALRPEAEDEYEYEYYDEEWRLCCVGV